MNIVWGPRLLISSVYPQIFSKPAIPPIFWRINQVNLVIERNALSLSKNILSLNHFLAILGLYFIIGRQHLRFLTQLLFGIDRYHVDLWYSFTLFLCLVSWDFGHWRNRKAHMCTCSISAFLTCLSRIEIMTESPGASFWVITLFVRFSLGLWSIIFRHLLNLSVLLEILFSLRIQLWGLGRRLKQVILNNCGLSVHELRWI